MNGHDSVLLETGTWRGNVIERAPKITVTSL